MARKQENNYFEMISGLISQSCLAANKLDEILNNYDFSMIAQNKDALHEIEHQADVKKHEIMQKLAREFITPIEREDIMQLIEEIDNVTDMIDDVLMKAYMFNVKTIKQETLLFSRLIVEICNCLMEMGNELYNFKKSKTLQEYIIKINHFEEEGDRIYCEAMKSLFENCQNPIEIMIWHNMYDSFENCCDACEHVSDVVQDVIMKNT